MNMFALVQRKIKTDESQKGNITTVRIKADMYCNYTDFKINNGDESKANTSADFQRALRKAFQAFDDVMQTEMND